MGLSIYLRSAVFLLIVSSVFGEGISRKKEFRVFDAKVNWFTAFINCSSQGMTLATIESQQDQDQLTNLIKQEWQVKPGDYKNWWIGGTDLHSEGDFLWFSTGQPMTYNNFALGEPNNDIYKNEHCVQIKTGGFENFKWNDCQCSDKNSFVCQKYKTCQ